MSPSSERDSIDELIGDIAGALVLVPGAGWVVSACPQCCKESRRHRSTAIKVAVAEAAEAGMSREDLGQCFQEDPRLVPLVARVLYPAGMNGQDETLVMLGAVLGQAAAGEQTDIDDAEVLVSVIDGLGKRHVEMLKLMSQPPDAERYPGLDRWNTGLLEMEMEATGVKQAIALVALASLTNAGALQELGLDGGAAWGGGGTVLAVTETGELLLEVLRKYQGSTSEPAASRPEPGLPYARHHLELLAAVQPDAVTVHHERHPVHGRQQPQPGLADPECRRVALPGNPVCGRVVPIEPP